MSKNYYVALLRGINVGGKNVIKMAELTASCRKIGFTDVSTYIQSGNIIFRSNVVTKPLLARRIESLLVKEFNYRSRTLLVSRTELFNIIAKAPRSFGNDPERYRYDVIFLIPPLTASKVIRKITLKEGIDNLHFSNRVLYFSRLNEKLGQSMLPKITHLPEYQFMTVRNWNTVTKLSNIIGEKE